MIIEKEAKGILSQLKKEDTWFGIKYNMNIYRGCQHGCIYCDSRSECYRVDNFDEDIIIKKNAKELLNKELKRKKYVGTIGTGAMSDPYIPIEKKYGITRECLKIIKRYEYPLHVITKSNLVTRDIDLLKDISKTYAAVSFTITTTDGNLAKIIEPKAPLPSQRFQAIKALSDEGIYTGITLMPILPFLEDSEENIISIVKNAYESGAKYIIPSFGVTMRDRQRYYFYKKLDENFPGLKSKYQKRYGGNYGCFPDNYKNLKKVFSESCKEYGIKIGIDKYKPTESQQLSFFDR